MWIEAGTNELSICAVLIAAAVAECLVVVLGMKGSIAESLAQACDMTELTHDDQVRERLSAGDFERVRVLGACPALVRSWAHEANVAIFEDSPRSIPRLELLPFLREQAVSVRYHRYGHLGLRELAASVR